MGFNSGLKGLILGQDRVPSQNTEKWTNVSVQGLTLTTPPCPHHMLYDSLPLRWNDRKNYWTQSLAGHVARMADRRGVYRVSVGKPEGRGPLVRHRHRWKDNIKMDFQEVVCGGMDWIYLAQDRDRWRALVNVVMNLRFPYNTRNFLTSWEAISFPRKTLLHEVSK